MLRAIKIRRPVQFTLRAVLAVVTLVCIWLGWISHGAQKQREGRARLQSLGGEVWGCSYPRSLEPIWRLTTHDNRVASCAAWLTSLVSVDFLTNVSEVRFFAPASLHPEAVTVLRSFPHLEAIEFIGTTIDAHVVPSLGQLPALRRITLNDVPLTPEIADQLSELPMLDEVRFVGSAACDNDIATLARLRRPKRLDFTDSELSWGGIWRLEQRLPTCEILPATSSHINDIVFVLFDSGAVGARGRLCPDRADWNPCSRVGCALVAIDRDGYLQLDGHKRVQDNTSIWKVGIEGTVHASEIGIDARGGPIVDAAKIAGLRSYYSVGEISGSKSRPPRRRTRQPLHCSARIATTALRWPSLRRREQRH